MLSNKQPAFSSGVLEQEKAQNPAVHRVPKSGMENC